MSLDSSRSSAIASRFASQPPSSSTSIKSSTSSPRLSSTSMKQPPRPPPIASMKPSFSVKTPSPPRTPTPQRPESPESERNPFMGSDEDEPSSPAPVLGRSTSAPVRPISKIQQNPVFQQLNSSGMGSRLPQQHQQQRPSAPVPGRNAALLSKMAPPPPQRAAPRPDSPQGLPPRLPSRSNSAILAAAEETPEEKERKHRLDKRRRVVQELLETEISYSKDMLLLQEVWTTNIDSIAKMRSLNLGLTAF